MSKIEKLRKKADKLSKKADKLRAEADELEKQASLISSYIPSALYEQYRLPLGAGTQYHIPKFSRLTPYGMEES